MADGASSASAGVTIVDPEAVARRDSTDTDTGTDACVCASPRLIVLGVMGCEKYRSTLDEALGRFQKVADAVADAQAREASTPRPCTTNPLRVQVVGFLGDPTATRTTAVSSFVALTPSAAAAAAAAAPLAPLAPMIVHLPVSDVYEHLPQKTWSFFHWARAQWPEALGVFKTDDDIVLADPAALARVFLATTTSGRAVADEDYWGFVTERTSAGLVHGWRVRLRCDATAADRLLRERPPTHPAAHYAFGHGYFLSQRAIEVVLAHKADFDASFLEDVCTGHVLNQHGLSPKRVDVAYVEEKRKW